MSNTITINVLGNTRAFQSSMRGVQNDLGRLGQASSKASGFLKNSLKAVGIAGGVAGVAIGKFAKDSITAASDLNETISKTETIFGKASPAILKWGDNAAKSIGMSKNEALTGLSTFGNFFDQIGIGADESAKMSKAFVQMSADLGSFHNAAPVDVMDALAGATRGEYDALQKYIPTINAAAVQQKAMAMTGKDSATALTEQEKATALYALALKGQGAAQGDFARTSGSLANQQKILASQFENVKAKVGTALLPVMQQLMGFLISDGIPAFEKLATWLTKNLPPAIEQVVAKFREFLPVIKSVATFIAENAGTILKLVAAFYAITAAVAAYNKVMLVVRTVTAVTTAVTTALAAAKTAMTGATVASTAATNAEAVAQARSKAAVVGHTIGIIAQKAAQLAAAAASKAWAAAQWLLNTALLANPIGLVIAAIVALVAIFVIAWKNSEKFREIVTKAWNAIKATTAAVWNFIKDLTLKTWNAIKEAATKAAEAVKSVVAKAWDSIKDATNKVWNGIKSLTQSVWNAIKSVVTTVVGAVLNVVRNNFNLVKNAISNAWNAAKDLTNKIWDGIKNAVRNAIETLMGFVRGIKGKVLGAFAGAASWLYNAGKQIIQGLVNGIKNMAGAAIGAAKGVVGDAISGAKNLLGINSPSRVFRDFGRYTVEGLALGLREKAGLAAQASTDLARKVAQGFEAPQMTLNAKTAYAGGAGTGYGAAPVTVTVNVPPTADKASIGREIQKTLDEYYRTGGTRRA